MFPLPLTPFEEYMLSDDCPAYPMTGIERLQFSGFLDRGAFEAALKSTIQRHPLLRTKVNRPRRGRPKWVDCPDWCPVIQGDAETKKVIPTAKALGVTVNDLPVRDLFLAVGRWRERRAVGNKRDWLRFWIPMGLRTEADEAMPMADSVSMMFIDRQAGDFTDAHRLLQDIHEKTHIKRMQHQYTFLLSLSVLRCLPSGLARKTQVDKCLPTSCLSNLGPVLDKTPLPRLEGEIVSGNLVLKGIDFAIPLRPYMNAAFCVYTYAGRLRVLMHFDPQIITDEQSGELLETYVQQILPTIQNNNCPGS